MKPSRYVDVPLEHIPVEATGQEKVELLGYQIKMVETIETDVAQAPVVFILDRRSTIAVEIVEFRDGPSWSAYSRPKDKRLVRLEKPSFIRQTNQRTERVSRFVCHIVEVSLLELFQTAVPVASSSKLSFSPKIVLNRTASLPLRVPFPEILR